MKTLASLLLLAFIILAVGNLTPSLESQASEHTAASDNAEFAGKIVRIYTSDLEQGSGHVLEDVELVTMGGRAILVGTSVDTGRDRDWTHGLRIGIPWERVVAYYALTPQQFQEKFIEYDQDID